MSKEVLTASLKEIILDNQVISRRVGEFEKAIQDKSAEKIAKVRELVDFYDTYFVPHVLREARNFPHLHEIFDEFPVSIIREEHELIDKVFRKIKEQLNNWEKSKDLNTLSELDRLTRRVLRIMRSHVALEDAYLQDLMELLISDNRS